MKNYRHGDVQLTHIEELPVDAKSMGARKELAYGEVTGHAHTIDIGELFEDQDGALYLKVDELAHLTHQEHEAKPVEPGVYRVTIKRQYAPEGGWQNVAD